MRKLPDDIRSLIQKHHRDSSNCKGCRRPCCYESGFATLANVEHIYEKYKDGTLLRDDYFYTAGLDFSKFALTYFDIVYKGNELAMFFPKHLSRENQLISIPGTNDYWDYRHSFFYQNPWLNSGCIFLKHKIPIGELRTNIACILHEDSVDDTLSAKPIDCVFLTCGPGQNIKRDDQTEAEFFRLLSVHFKDEIEQCNAKVFRLGF